MIPYEPEAYQLLHEGVLALAKMEANGIRIDEKYLRKTSRRLKRRSRNVIQRMENTDIMRRWRKEFKRRFNLDSSDQLGHILFEIMGYEGELTDNQNYRTDESSLSKIDDPFIRDYLLYKKYQKSLNTYLRGIQREVVNGFIHPNFNLHLVRTFRSSSSDPNFQNIPIRDPKIGKLIRQSIISRPGRRITELDYSGIEVGIAACYHLDPNMIEYLEDSEKDMHRDMAAECFALDISELLPSNDKDAKRIKKIRYCGKNMFVFPQFYGDWFIDCAQHLWEATADESLCLRNGLSIRAHLKKQGIHALGELDPNNTEPGTFVHYIQQVEQRFWNKRFPVYARWKKKWVNKYNERGWMKTLTGFICQGVMKRNEIINYCVQGSAFHCLLKALIELQKEIERQKMKTFLIGQIHDTVIGDVPDDELNDYLAMANEIMCNKMKGIWDWIICPLEIEAEVTPINGNWSEKEEIPIV